MKFWIGIILIAALSTQSGFIMAATYGAIINCSSLLLTSKIAKTFIMDNVPPSEKITYKKQIQLLDTGLTNLEIEAKKYPQYGKDSFAYAKKQGVKAIQKNILEKRTSSHDLGRAALICTSMANIDLVDMFE